MLITQLSQWKELSRTTYLSNLSKMCPFKRTFHLQQRNCCVWGLWGRVTQHSVRGSWRTADYFVVNYVFPN